MHGCFWHLHKCQKESSKWPQSNREYWIPKLEANRARDARNRLTPGAWTDDTALALALADSLAASEALDCRDVMDRFVGWRNHGDYSCTGRCFNIGATTSQALDRYLQTGDPIAGSTNPRSAGNGSLMRLTPVGH